MAFIRKTEAFIRRSCGDIRRNGDVIRIWMNLAFRDAIFVAKIACENGVGSFIRTMVCDIRKSRVDIRRWSEDISTSQTHIRTLNAYIRRSHFY